jgi:hypothetical protein
VSNIVQTYMKNMNLNKIKEDVMEQSLEIPFGNSIFQSTEILLNKEITNGRKLRALLLNLNSKIRTLEELSISIEIYEVEKEKKEIDIERYKNTGYIMDTLEAKKIELEIQKDNINKEYLKKQVQDTAIEIQAMYKALKQLDRMTRQEFEEEEQQHFKLSIIKKELGGIAPNLLDIGLYDEAFDMLNANKDFANDVKEIIDTKLLKR